jgi:hypothetical protein
MLPTHSVIEPCFLVSIGIDIMTNVLKMDVFEKEKKAGS